MWRNTAVVFFCVFVTSVYLDTNQIHHEDDVRTKRQINSIPLVFPYGAIYKLLIGFSSPVPIRDHINLAFAANFQYQYSQFQNISQLSRYYFINTISREQRDAILESKMDERLTFYRSLADMLDAKGFIGEDCVLRSICEAAQYPVEGEGLIGKILHILLTPDYGHTAFSVEDPKWVKAMAPYTDAATAGRQMFSCEYIYSGCPEGQGVMELISVLRDE